MYCKKMDSQLVAAGACVSAIITIALLLKQLKNKKKKRVWVRPWIGRRKMFGIHNNLLKELQNEDPKHYENYLRMDENTFNFVVSKVSKLISKEDTHMRSSISVQDRLMVTLRFLATGESYSSLQYSSRIPQCTLSIIIPETCKAIYESMKNEFFKVPRTSEEWEFVANEFEKKWNVYNTIGAMDGKHIRIKCPKNSGSHYFNYKHFNSIILFALADANYKFLYVDVGANGRVGDAGVFANSTLKQCLSDQSLLNIPKDRRLPNSNLVLPFVVLADDAFPLRHNIMKPYPLKNITKEERIFNYRLSRGRRMIESSFGILATRFRVFLTTINLPPDKVKLIVLAACTLHNMLVEKRKHIYTHTDFRTVEVGGHCFIEPFTEEVCQQMQPIQQQRNFGHMRHGTEIRNDFKTFYNGPGKVPWQENYIGGN